MAAEQKPGPGWSKKTDGSYAVDEIVYNNFSGARVVASVLHIFAWVVLIGGIAAAITAFHQLHGAGSSSDDVATVIGAILGGTIFAAAILAFFGYVLELLIAIHFDIRMSDAWEVAKARQAMASKAPTSTEPVLIGENDGGES